MTTENATPARAGLPAWVKRVIWVAALLAVLVIAYFILAAFLPRWWAQQAGEMASGSIGKGVAWGLLFGILCTLVPLLLCRAAWSLRRRSRMRFLLIALLLLGIALAIPNLLTLSVALGSNNAAHAGERILDVDAPGFRGASLVGAIIGALAFLGVLGLGYTYRKRGEEVSKMRGDLKQRDAHSSGESPGPEL